MRHVLIAATAALLVASSVVTAGAATADPIPADPTPAGLPGPPYVDHTEWAHWGDLSSLRVYPTPAGRHASGQLNDAAGGDEAWTEVLASAPDADLPGMRAQFLCHWSFAELVQPGKSSWNLEPWRPVVDDATMVDPRCNPGGTEEPF